MKYIITILFLISFNIHAQDQYKIISSDDNGITIEVNFNNIYSIVDTVIEGKQVQLIRTPKLAVRNIGEPWLPALNLNIGIPHDANPTIAISNLQSEILDNKFIIPFPEEDPEIKPYSLLSADQNIYSTNKLFPESRSSIIADFIMRYARIINIEVVPFQFNPVKRELVINKQFRISINYNAQTSNLRSTVNDGFTNSLIQNTIINYNEAKNWIQKNSVESSNPAVGGYWYDPAKTYYKVYLEEKGVYRLSYDYLAALNIPLQNVLTSKLQIFYLEDEIPLYIKDSNSNGIFESGDYLEFVGYPPLPSEYSGLNIYNNENLVWFSYQADSVGLRYIPKDATPVNFVNAFQSVLNSVHYEVDTLYERLGHASNSNRDYWYWAKVSGSNGFITNDFEAKFLRPKNITLPLTTLDLRVNMHGMTFNSCSPDHKVLIYFWFGQLIGEHNWDGPDTTTYRKTVDLTQIVLLDTNRITIQAYGDLPPCPPSTTFSDEIRVNWFEIDYMMDLRADTNNIIFKTSPNVFGRSRIEVFNWLRDDMKIFTPQHNELLINPDITHNQFNSVLFVDDLYERTEYFCVAEDYFLLPDSIVIDNNVGDLRNLANGADYLIIYHSDFLSVAQRLADHRASYFPDTTITNPRIAIVDIQNIYDEFAGGLLKPEAIQSFIKYSFENWVQPAPAYVVLIGDMSYDYRKLIPDSRPNFIPAMPYHAPTYGQAASDNLFTTVAGNDQIPDLAIGRLSCETVEEGNILVDKIVDYPDDSGKKWRQNAILISSGLSLADEQQFGFNDAHLYLDNTFVRPYGYSSTKVFRYPSKPEHEPFQGDGPEVRAAFNEGGVLASYYGHGGGFQWDLIFTNDDIYELQNEGRLPFISSVTCYTAHFDNQNVFGEQFNKVPGKGSISFWGSSGLTYWGVGKTSNQYLFEEIFKKNSLVTGKSILESKIRLTDLGGIGYVQINLLTLLGEPLLKLALPDKPDFVIDASDITLEPRNPIVNRNVEVKVNLKNFGRYFPIDTVTVQIFAESQDTSFTLGTFKRPNFNDYDSLIIDWVPALGGLYTFTVEINETEIIPEMDHSDNVASIVFPVFDLGEPSIVEPVNGLTTNSGIINFLFVDNGYYAMLDAEYIIQIDTTLDFTTPLITSQKIYPSRGILEWQSPPLAEGIYFWRAKVFNAGEEGDWNSPRILNVTSNSSEPKYYVNKNALKQLVNFNINYSDSLKSLLLNTNPLPPRPSNETFIDSVNITLPPDINSLSTITTDGSYIFYGHMASIAGPSKIYKIGTGFGSTTRWQDYGAIPDLEVPIWGQMFYYGDQQNGSIYVPTGDPYSLLKINPTTGDTSRVQIPDGMLNATDALVGDGIFYLTSDGRYVYNLAYINELGEYKYTLRTFDPLNNWAKVGADFIPSGSSYQHFKNFFVAHGFLYPYENFSEGYLRRINLVTGTFEEEWISFVPFQAYFAWTFDWLNDKVYTSSFRGVYVPKFTMFEGQYFDASGSVFSHQIGPAAEWNSAEFEIDDLGSTGTHKTYLNGFNKSTRLWDTLFVDPPQQFDISSVDANAYPFIQFRINLVDTSFGTEEPVKVKSFTAHYVTPPELMIIRDDIIFSPDTILQGFDTELATKMFNIGKAGAENLTLDYKLSSPSTANNDTIFISRDLSIPPGGSLEFIDTMATSKTIFNNIVSLLIDYPGNEYFTFNNISENYLFVARDSTRPLFQLTFDGKEIINGDIVSAKPEVVISLEDNSPLPLDTTFFTIVHNNIPLNFSDPKLQYTYTPYPNSKSTILWTPELEDGRHTLEVLAKDASGNFFDSTSSRTIFNVFSDADLREVFNYPNPFAEETHFTFELRGTELPEEFIIRIYTVAGRLIWERSISPVELNIGFNKISWNGRDQDGDEVGNGLYFYKIIAKFRDESKSVTQKLAKVK